MTPNQIGLVKETWQSVAAISDQAAAIFYAKLFELDADLQPLFSKADMEEQGKKLMQMIGVAVANLHKLDEVAPAVANLGRRHVDYGVKDADYDTVRHALIWTLGQGLGDAFTPDVERAWGETYGTLASVMKSAAGQAAA